MGPRRIRRGERLRPPQKQDDGGELQWGHGEFAVENDQLDRRVRVGAGGFNGATANSPWRTRRAVDVVAPAGARFNGATANSPWRTSRMFPVLAEAYRLLQWGHGEFAVENGDCVGGKRLRELLLQWGHGEFAVENFAGRVQHPLEQIGFNGATANSPWRTPQPRGAGRPRSPRRFNGATANSPWRTAWQASARQVEGWLQWGHGEFAVENLYIDGYDESSDRASMGPRRIRRGERVGGARPLESERRASMGPRRIRRGEREATGVVSVLRKASMGPRRIRCGEPDVPVP